MSPLNRTTTLPEWLALLARESPFRVLTRMWLKRCAASVHTREQWAISRRPAYLTGLVHAAGVARHEGYSTFTAVEFGVAGGNGLLALQDEALAVERELGVQIHVVGFDSGQGLIGPTGDHRDHPDYWKEGDFPLDEPALRENLLPSTRLILGDVRDTVPEYVERLQEAPLGFVSFDLDLYSSTTHALDIFTHPRKWTLTKVPLYFDDVMEPLVSHRFAGELLAIEEFNQKDTGIKIDRWRGVKMGRPFPEHPYLDCMYLAHDLEAISECVLERTIRQLPMRSHV